MGGIIALDLSLTATGFCCGDRSEVWKPGRLRGHERIADLLMAVDAACTHENPAAVFIEGYAFGAKGRAVFDIAELGGVVRHHLYERGIPWADVPPSVLKKYATGAGNANKDAMLAAAIRRFGFPGSDNNAADAWLLWHLAMQECGTPAVTVPKVQSEAVKVTWNLP